MSTPAKILLAAATDWPFPARLAGAFAALDAKVEAVCLKHGPLRQSGIAMRRHGFSPLKPLASLAEAITASSPDLVVPCDDLMAELLWRLGQARRDLVPLLARSCGDANAFATLSSRNAFLRQAAQAGAPAADTIVLDDTAGLERAVATFGLPLVLKADGSWGGEGVVIARDRAEARAALAKFSRASRLRLIAAAIKRREPHLLVRARFPRPPQPGAQRFIAGRPATSSIACWQGRLLAANHFDVLVSNGTGPATVLGVSHDPVMEETARRLAAFFGLSGLHGLDYMRGEDGQLRLLEINPRATPSAHLALGPDHDLAAALLNAAGHPVPDRPAATLQNRIALFPQEWRREPESPYLDTAYHDLPRDDPALAAALGWNPAALTSFSQIFPRLPGIDVARKSPLR